MRSYLSRGSTFTLFLALFACSDGPSGPDGSATCDPGEGPSLPVGGSIELTASEARRFCARAGDSAAEFVAVAFVASTTGVTLSALAENTIGLQGPPLPVAADARSTLGTSRPNDRFHYELRERERTELSPLVLGSAAGAAAAASGPAPVVPSVGDFLQFNAQSNQACSNPTTITAQVRAVSQRAIVAADVGNPAGGFGAGDYAHYAATFDTLLAPIADANFGAASDIDQNGRTILLFTREVNRRTPAGATTFTAGFFFSRDLFPKVAPPGSTLGSCATSNEAELLYLLVPDPDGTVNGNKRSRDFVERLTLGTIIHEDQHLVNAARRLHGLGLGGETWSEEVWLNEGLSHVAEELLFYRESGFGAGQNISHAALTAAGNRAVTAFNRHQAFNLSRFHEHLESASSSAVFSSQDALATRGAAWSFLRYAADRKGGSQAAFFLDLVNSSTKGIPNLAEAIGNTATVYQWMTDWGVAVYADDRVPNASALEQDRSWNHPSLYAALGESGSAYPIETFALVAGAPRTRSLIGGGTVYFRFGVAAGERGEVEITSGGGAAPQTVRVTLLRTR